MTQRYPAEKIVPVKRQIVNVDPVVSVMVSAVQRIWLSGVARKMISKVERYYWRYCGIVDDNAG